MTQKIAIIGTGISGMAAAWLLNEKYDITVYEKNDYIGGHSHTVTVDYDGTTIPVDTGFIVFNHVTYPNLVPMFEHLDVPTIESNMSFGASVANGKLEYACTDLSCIFAQKKNLFNPMFWRILLDVKRFFKESIKYKDDMNHRITLGQYLDQLGMSDAFKRYFILPMGGAIWSCPVDTMLDYPAKTFIRFFYNHGLLSMDGQHQWYTVGDGSIEYVKRITESFKDKIQLNTQVKHVISTDNGIEVEDVHGNKAVYDQVIIASHGNQAMSMLHNPTEEEKEVLTAFKTQPNRVVLHRDLSQMPKAKKAWASWVYMSDGEVDTRKHIAVTYWMNRLQSIDYSKPLFVTVNPITEPDPSLVFQEFEYHHPIFDFPAIQSQEQIDTIQGKRGIWFCGAYQRYGFHEDGLQSALKVVNALGVKAPWQ